MSKTFTLTDIASQDAQLLGCEPGEIVSRLPARLDQGVMAWSRQTPDATAIVCRTNRITYRSLAEAVSATRQFLLDQGVRAGDRVMLVSENGAALMCLVLALSEMDGVAVIVNARLAARELDLIEADCQPRIVIYTIEDSRDASSHAESRGAARHETRFGGLAVSATQDVESGQTGLPADEQVLAMIYTTGTTGTPKGVMLTHRNLTFIAYVSGRLRGIRAGDAIYCVLPMSHVFGLSAVSCSVLFSGGCVHLVARFDAAEVLRALAEDDIAGFLGVPAMYTRMLEAVSHNPGFRAPRLRFMYSGGAPLDASIKGRVEQVFGLTLNNGYGLTESGPTICQTRPYAPLESCSVGFPLPGVAVRIQDSQGRPVPRGEVGQLWAKGPNIMKGYFRKPELTAAVLQAGWLDTGDLAFEDEDGALNIAGRTKELIIRSGFNVYPPEVESVLNSHPEVAISAVVGRNVDGDETIVAFVQPTSGSTIDVGALHAFARDRLAGYKVPSEIIVMEELPAAPSGKILKARLLSTQG